MPNFLSEKDALRSTLRAMREKLTKRERERLSHAAACRLLDSEIWKNARCVALYMAIRGETDTSLLLEDAWKTGKQTLLPLCSRSEHGLMRFVPCSGAECLMPGRFGILEPPRPSEGLLLPVPDLIVTPGVAFDRAGTRLGQGGGYYDRLLAQAQFANSLRMGFAYPFQIVDTLPREPWDRPLQAVCTGQGIVWTAES